MIKKTKVYVIMTLIIVTLLTISFFIHHKINTVDLIPDCVANLKMKIKNKDSYSEINYLINIVNSSKNKNEPIVILTGNGLINGKEYIIARQVTLNIEANGRYISTIVKKVAIDPTDNLEKDINIKGIPIDGQRLTLLITKVSDSSYIFEENNSPLFLCKAHEKR